MITVEDLSKSFVRNGSTIRALSDVTIDINAGSLFGVFGASGSGKSTLARCVALQERPDRGAVRYDGVNTAALDARRLREVRRRLAVVDNKVGLRAERTIAGNIAAPLEYLGIAGPHRRRKVGRLLDVVGLTNSASRLPGDVTADQRRRVAIARALVTEPSLLVVDNPTENVHSNEHGSVLSTLDRVRAELGTTVVVATQHDDVIRRVCDQIAVLDAGTVRESGTLLELLADSSSYTAQKLLPTIDAPRHQAGYDRTADVVLIGFAAVGALLPEASGRFDVEIAATGGGLTRIGDTPVAHFRIGIRGERADAALAWIAERGGHVHQAPHLVQALAA